MRDCCDFIGCVVKQLQRSKGTEMGWVLAAIGLCIAAYFVNNQMQVQNANERLKLIRQAEGMEPGDEELLTLPCNFAGHVGAVILGFQALYLTRMDTSRDTFSQVFYDEIESVEVRDPMSNVLVPMNFSGIAAAAITRAQVGLDLLIFRTGKLQPFVIRGLSSRQIDGVYARIVQRQA